jgi:hypothetical protein
MTSQMIRRFTYIGEYLETKLIQTRQELNTAIVVEMKDEGFVPLLDVNPVWATDYLGGERFRFVFTMQGVYVGKDKAWQTLGVADGKLIPNIPKSK